MAKVLSNNSNFTNENGRHARLIIYYYGFGKSVIRLVHYILLFEVNFCW